MKATLTIDDKSFTIEIPEPVKDLKLATTKESVNFKKSSNPSHFLYDYCTDVARKQGGDRIKYETIKFEVNLISSGDTTGVSTDEITSRINKALHNEFNT